MVPSVPASPDCGCLRRGNPERSEALTCCLDGAAHVDAAAGIVDHHRVEALALGVLGRVAYAEVQGEAGHEHTADAALAQVAGEAGWRRVVVLEDRRVRVN